MINASVAQLAQRWNLPYYATAGISDTKTLDAQCGYEAAVNNLLVSLAGADFIHDAAGLMEFAMTVSPEKLVLDDEILGACMRAVRGVRVDDATLAVDAIRKAGPAGNFVAARHTRKFMRKEHYLPRLSDRDKRETWEAGGRKTAADRAHERVRSILSAQAAPCIDRNVARALLERFEGIEAAAYEEVLSS
jgi:trimethylamine--corrinoid protein Co-methyltransferase